MGPLLKVLSKTYSGEYRSGYGLRFKLFAVSFGYCPTVCHNLVGFAYLR